jgi:invasion protein IalB
MNDKRSESRVSGRLVASAAAALIALAGTALAQQQPQKAPAGKAPPAAKPAAAAAPARPQQPAQPQTAWVKLCEMATFGKKAPDGKETKEERNICLTQHEQLDGRTGVVLVSAAVRVVEGSNTPQFMVMVPLGMTIPSGLRVAVASADIWGKVQRNEPFDEKQLKPFGMPYFSCHSVGCTAEIALTPDIMAEMQSGAGMLVRAVDVVGRTPVFFVPLTGFKDTHAGAPVDNKAYVEARRAFWKQLETQQQAQIAQDPKLAEAYKKFQEAQKGLAEAAQSKAAPQAPPPAAQPPAKKP